MTHARMTRVETLARRLQARWPAIVDPWWLAPGALGLALVIAALAQLLERGCCDPPTIIGGPTLAFIVALRAAQADLRARAAAEERHRVAREVHDVIAHALTITLLQITGARHVLFRDPASANAALGEAERLGRQSLADIRRTVGLLGDKQSPGTEAPLPTLEDLPDLVEGFRHAGLAVDLRVHG